MNTDFLGLALTAPDETSLTFYEWRNMINGTGAGSNMKIIDEAVQNLNYVDVSTDFNPSSDDPYEFLIGKGAGKYYLYLSGSGVHYYVDNISVSPAEYSMFSVYSSDGILVKRIYISDDDGTHLVYDVVISDSLEFATPLRVPTPENSSDAVNKGYVDGIKTLVYGNFDVPQTHLAIEGSDISNFFPTPRVGDYVIGRNLCVGIVTLVNSPDVRVRGTDCSISGVIDVTSEFEESAYTDPALYLANRSVGKFCISYNVPGDTVKYESVNWGGYAEVTAYSGGEIDKFMYFEGSLLVHYTISDGSVVFSCSAMSTETPTRNFDLVNKAYVDALEARVATLEAAIQNS